MGKLGKIIAFTAFLAVLIGIGMVAVQGKGSLVIRDFDLTTLARVKKIQIGKLRDLIKGDVTHEYMLDDAFLLKWLLDQDFEVKQAAELIKQVISNIINYHNFSIYSNNHVIHFLVKEIVHVVSPRKIEN